MDSNTDPIERETRAPAWVHGVNLGTRGAGLERLLLALWTFGRWGQCGPAFVWPTVAAVAELLGRPRRTVEDRLAGLLALGWVRRGSAEIDGEIRAGLILAWRTPGEFETRPDSVRDPAGPVITPDPTAERGPTDPTAERGSDPPHGRAWTRPSVDRPHGRAWGDPTAERGSTPRPAVVGSDQDRVSESSREANSAPTPPDPRPSVDTAERGPTRPTAERGSYEARSNHAGRESTLGAELPADIARAVSSHQIAGFASMSPAWCSDLAATVSRLRLDVGDVIALLDRWGELADAAKRDGTLARQLQTGTLPELKCLFWSRKAERDWVLRELDRLGQAKRDEAPPVDEVDPLASRSADVEAFRARLRGDAR